MNASKTPSNTLGVVTVTFSPGEHLGALIDSLDQATALPTHIVLADNGSTDGAPEQQAARSGSLPKTTIEFLDTGGNIGYGAGVNRGIAQLRQMREAGTLRGDYVLVVNPDAVFTPGSIDKLLECAAEHPRAAAIGPLIREPDGSVYPSARAVPELISGIGHALFADIWPSNPFSRRYRADSVMDQVRDAGWLSGSCLLLRWDAFESVGGFDSRYFMYFEDVDLGNRFTESGWRNIFCPDAEITHAQGHAASSHPEITVRAHHESAYRFMAGQLSGWYWAPVRALLKVGLTARCSLILARKQARKES